MLRHTLTGFLVLTLFPTSVLASTILESAKNAIMTEQQQAASRPPNPYKTPAIVLLAGGAGLMVLGLAQDRGAELRTNTTGTNVRINETGGSKTALTVLGVAVMGGGGFLYWRGEQKRRPSLMPGIRLGPGRASIQSSFSF